MEDYKKLSVRYLKMNKRRSVVTVIGVVVAVTVLYVLLNLGWSRLLKERENIRETQDYEIVLFTETQSQIEQITADDKVKSASIGKYYYDDYNNPKMYNNALYINTRNPYRLDIVFEQLCSTYQVEGTLNGPLAWTYMQGGEENMTEILILVTLLISYIFAIFGVGIVRNSIQLSTLEQIKDYGNLRCVGASKGQLKAVVYIEGAVLEITGIVIGVLAGTIVSVIIGYFLKWNVGFHFVPVVPIAIAFLGDLFFAMEENCKVIVNMTPVSAIRGEYRIRKEKIKVRKQSIFGKIFGIEGDYAYKSIMRNPGRFHKTVWALAIGIAAFVAISGVSSSLNNVAKNEKERWKYYHVYYEHILKPYETADQVKSSLPPASVLENITNLEEVTEAKRIYSSKILLNDIKATRKKYNKEYLEKTYQGELIQLFYDDIDTGNSQLYTMINLASVTCYGYDKEDYQRYQKALVDGTLDVSENGLVLVNGGNIGKKESESLREESIDVNYTNYKVGDTIDIVDMKKFRFMISERLEELSARYEAEKEKLPDMSKEKEENPSMTTPEEELDEGYQEEKVKMVNECWQRLVDEGSYKTYTIEGIVSEDVNHRNEEQMVFILPMEQYYEFTGTDESMVSGMQYHFDKFPVEKFERASSYEEPEDTMYWFVSSGYPEIMNKIQSIKNVMYGFVLGILFIVMMSIFNIINTTASNLYLRRKEFAQLRVLGISKKRLTKMVLLEGVIAAIAANLIGIVLGGVISGGGFRLVVTILSGYQYHFPFIAALLGILVSTLILCGSIYVSLKGLKQDMAGDLAAGGD